MKLDYLLPGDYFQDSLENLIFPYLKQRLTVLAVPGFDGKRLYARYYKQNDSDTVICISHGFTEFADKYSEVIYYFLKQGYSVAILEHRGHGNSYRAVKNLSKVHIDSYDTYVKDYHCFVELVKQDFAGQRRFLFGHSMGGCIASLYVETYPEDFEKLVLSSPMLDVESGGIPKPAAILLGKTLVALNKGEQYLGSQNQDWTPGESFKDSCCTERGRFLAWQNMRRKNPYYQMGSGTIEWMTASLKAAPKAVAQAKRIRIPVLLLQAGQDHMVRPQGQNQFIKNVHNGRIKVLPDAKHETFNCDDASRTDYWEAIMDFLAE